MKPVAEYYKALHEKFPSLKKAGLLLLLGTAAVLLVLSEWLTGTGKEKAVQSSAQTEAAQTYIERQEKRLEKLLSTVEGAGNVRVMITLESCFEKVYATYGEYQEQTEEGKHSADSSEEYLVVKSSAGGEECPVIKVYEPRVAGVAVVATGAHSAEVRRALTETVTAVFAISSTKVSVEKMKNSQEESQ